ncbi:MAG: 4-(cytidine 5'-diphospho)-2-C-methyl-D-erythritol kinase [Burkholderiales bacterium]
MKALYDVPAPAKLNLFLHVTGRRADGLHLLQSVFMLIDWCDRLHFEPRTDGVVSREDLTAPLPADDLVVRAAKALQDATGCRLGTHIGIEKRIPAEAGMGGGSSDAASCLLALNRLWSLGLSLSALENIGLTLGADVPFFLRGRNAWVEGVGERITPIELASARFAVLKPAEGVSTASIFGSRQLKRETGAATIAGFAADPWGFGHNDLQPVAEQFCPAVSQGIERLAAAGLKARMTGSGSAVFAYLPQSLDVATGGLNAPAGNWQYRECCNLAVHPLSGWATSVIEGARKASSQGSRQVG